MANYKIVPGSDVRNRYHGKVPGKKPYKRFMPVGSRNEAHVVLKNAMGGLPVKWWDDWKADTASDGWFCLIDDDDNYPVGVTNEYGEVCP